MAKQQNPPNRRPAVQNDDMGVDVPLMIEMPFAPLPAEYVENPFMGQLNLRLFDQQKLVALRTIRDGLVARRARLTNGNLVDGPQSALYWLLENCTFIG